MQDVIVELQFKGNDTRSQLVDKEARSQSRSLFAGWTGLESSNKGTVLVDRRGVQDQNCVVEVDSTFAGLFGLVDGQKVGRSMLRVEVD